MAEQDEFCQYSPPYRKIDLESNKQFNVNVTHEMLKGKKEEIELINNETKKGKRDLTILSNDITMCSPQNILNTNRR